MFRFLSDPLFVQIYPGSSGTYNLPAGSETNPSEDNLAFQRSDSLIISIEGFRCEGAEDGEGIAGCRECGEGAGGVVRGDGDNVGNQLGIFPFFSKLF